MHQSEPLALFRRLTGATFPVRGEGCAVGRSFADDVDGANLAVSRQGEGGARSGGRGLGAGAARDGQMKDCFDGAVLFSLRRGGGTAILEESNRF